MAAASSQHVTEDEELRWGARCRFLRDEIVSLEAGDGGGSNSRVIRNLVRYDGLKHRNVTCAFVVHRESPTEAIYNGTLVVHSFGICCECLLTLRLQLSLLIGGHMVRSLPWQEAVTVADDNPMVRYAGLMQLGDFEAAALAPELDGLVEIRMLLDITSASPTFLLPPQLPPLQPWTLLCQEDPQLVQVACSDGSLSVERALLMRESPQWRSSLCKSESESASSSGSVIDCSEFSTSDMKVFLFYLQTQLFYDLARFDTFRTMARIAAAHSVSSVARRCAIFVNECVLLAEADQQGGATGAAGGASRSPVSSRIRWTPGDLIAIWSTTVNQLGEENLGMALMRLISKSNYSEINRLEAFQQLDATTKGTFYHHLLTCREKTAAAAPSDGGQSASPHEQGAAAARPS